MEWVRGDTIGYGSFAKVSVAKPRSQIDQIPALLAVKYCEASCSASLINEKEVLEKLKGCPQIIRLFGDDFSSEKGEKLYNLLVEFASGGDLGDKIKNSGTRRLTESDARRHTKSILRGLRFIHGNGFVHCDIKPQNILLCSAVDGGEEVAKIADFGLAKKAGEKVGVQVRGTPLYMSPEMVADGEQEAPADLWALGCVVAEMVTGAPAWRFSQEENFCKLLLRIGVGDELPEIPEVLSEEGKDFLRNCLVKDPRKRWTAEMLLSHPFVADLEEDCPAVSSQTAEGDEADVTSTSPRCPFDFPNMDIILSSTSSSITSLPSPAYPFKPETSRSTSPSTPPAERLRRLATEQTPDWCVSSSWVTIW